MLSRSIVCAGKSCANIGSEMADSHATTSPETPAASPVPSGKNIPITSENVPAPTSSPPVSQSQHRHSWARVRAVFASERITAAFTVVLALATLALVGTAYFQHNDALDAIQETKRLAVATENAARERRQVASAELVLKLRDKLDDSRF